MTRLPSRHALERMGESNCHATLGAFAREIRTYIDQLTEDAVSFQGGMTKRGELAKARSRRVYKTADELGLYVSQKDAA